ncbi:MAG: DNA recombination protein RmuC [Fibrobacter sp.]|nr:DNA recombination protein RmuC [Fibrobacter sp.]
MEIIFIVTSFVAGAVIGAIISHLSCKGKNASLQAQLETLREILNQTRSEAQSNLEKTKKEDERRIDVCKMEAAKNLEQFKKESAENLEKAKKDASDYLEQFKRESAVNLEKAKEEHRQLREAALKEQQARFDETLSKVTAQMKSATEEMLKQRQKEFSESSGQSIAQILKPLNESIVQMKTAMAETSLKQTEFSGVLKTQIENAMQMSHDAKASAEELSRVFKHESKIQGDWGETVLNNLLDGQGAHYSIQETLRDAQGNVIKAENGRSMRPDVILHLDHKRDVIIDSKVSMTAFMDYVNAETDEARNAALAAHVTSIKKHVEELSRKDYSSYVKPPKVKMDYVIMFVPHSAALWTALNAAPTLWSDAMAKKVYIVDEQTLYAALRMIDLTWTQIVQAQNHEKVYDLANEIIERVGQFMKKYQAIGNALNVAQKAFDDGEKKLSPSGQSILTSCQKLLKLGAKQSDKNPIPELQDLDDALALPEDATSLQD